MPPLETLPPPPGIRGGGYFTSGLFCLQMKHLTCEYFLTFCFSRGGVVNASPNPKAGGPPLVRCPRLLIQYIRSYPPYRRPFPHQQPEDAPGRDDRDPQTRDVHVTLLHSNRGYDVFVCPTAVLLKVSARQRRWIISVSL